VPPYKFFNECWWLGQATNLKRNLIFFIHNMKLKILQWNIWFQERAENILKVIKRINPDIICCQEVTI